MQSLLTFDLCIIDYTPYLKLHPGILQQHLIKLLQDLQVFFFPVPSFEV
jgi:hypothetical protein